MVEPMNETPAFFHLLKRKVSPNSSKSVLVFAAAPIIILAVVRLGWVSLLATAESSTNTLNVSSISTSSRISISFDLLTAAVVTFVLVLLGLTAGLLLLVRSQRSEDNEA